MSDESKERGQKPTFIQIVVSTLAAAFGVQSRKNLEKDFSQSSFLPFVFAGVIFTILLVLLLVVVVKVVLSM